MIWKDSPNKNAALVFFLLAVAIRIIFVVAVAPPPLETDAKEYDALGLRISQGKGYINSLGEPTALRPPLYPIFLGLIYYIFGHDLFLVRVIQSMLGAGICVLVYLIAFQVFDKNTAHIAGFICCLYLPLVFFTSEILTETLFSFFLVLGIYVLISKGNCVNLFVSGLIFGLALLTRPFLIFFFPFLFLWIVLNKKIKTIRALSLLILGLLLILLPWTLRNYIKLDAFIPLTNNAGTTLYYSYIIPEQGFGFSPSPSKDVLLKIKDETERNKYSTKESIRYITKNPIKALKLVPIKILYFIYPFDGHWYPASLGSRYNIFWGIVFFFSGVGIVHSLFNSNINEKLILFLFFSFSVGIIVFYGIPRFRFPIEPLLIGFAASGALWLYRKNIFIFYLILLTNVMLFLLFRFFSFQGLFEFLKSG